MVSVCVCGGLIFLLAHHQKSDAPFVRTHCTDDGLSKRPARVQANDEVTVGEHEPRLHHIARLEADVRIYIPGRLDERCIEINAARRHAERSMKMRSEVALATSHIDDALDTAQVVESRSHGREQCPYLRSLLGTLPPGAA